ncbi:Chromate resistance protein ChrB [Saccharopolyspora hattusasensis]|uniref:Chromate resistance protein ChrB n=1 Tax=Saccharopolyspora hattusasensis TaxID=1128679 RepID=UPI003D97184C
MPSNVTDQRTPGEWVLLSYRMPREPSTPRIAVWRKLKRLGVAQLADGVVALPTDAGTREHLEWLADEIVDGGGTTGIWIARPTTADQERELAASMAQARAAEYRALTEEATTAVGLPENARLSTARRLRTEMRRITRRDYFPPAEREQARRAVEALLHPTTTDLPQET